MCLNAGKVPYVKFKVHSYLTAFLSLQGVLGTVNGTLLAYPISFVGLDSHALLLNLHYKRGYKGLLMCLNAATVPYVNLGFHSHLTSFSLMQSLYAAAAAKSLQSCPSLCNPIDGSPPGSPVPWILQARTLEWVAISFSNA